MTTVFINELHYDNDGTDTGEAIEIAGPAATDLTGWNLVLYNGNGGASYTTTNLSGIIPDQNNGFGTVFFSYPSNGIQNGSPDGIVLVDNGGNVIQFLSYEGSFTAVGGPADGLTSTDIGVSESSTTPVGFSLQLTGTGSTAEDFTWTAPSDDSFGNINVGQSFGVSESVIVSVAATDANAAEASQDPGTFTISRTSDTNADLTVEYTVGGTATNGTDYTPTLSGTAVIANGQSSVDITVTPADDSDVEGTETIILRLTDTADYDLGTSSSAIVNIADNDDVAAITPIYDIQGDGDNFTSPEYISPLDDQQVTTQGVVTAIAGNGFYIQDEAGDNNDDTSDGIFVFTGDSQISISTPAIGDIVQVSGTVDEFFQATQIDSVTALNVIGTSSITPIILGVDRTAPTEIVDDAGSTDYDVTRDGRDFYESLEGMLVTLPDGVAVSLTNQFNEFYAIANLGANATGTNSRGGITISEDTDPNNPIGADLNPERIQIDGNLTTNSNPDVNVGDLLGDITGVVDYNFDDYSIRPLSPVTVTSGGLTRETTNLVGTEDQLTVASYNVENLDPSDGSRFDAIADQIVNNLQTPDIIGLQEVQDNDGSANTNVTSADVTLQTLVDAIASAGGPTYEFIDNPFIGDDTNGGEPGGNIRTAFLYDPSRVDFVEGSLQTVTDPTDQQTNPNNPFFNSRLPLVADFEFNGQTVTLVNNHFSSKGGSDPLFGDVQPPANGSLDERIDQAQAVNDFVSNILTNNPDANIAALGDFNEFQFFEPLDILEQNLTNLTESLPETGRYTFNFEGNSQALDHILVSDNLTADVEYDIVHINSEFNDQVSDHDPPVARLTLASLVNEINGTRNADNIIGTNNPDLIAGNNGDDTIDGRANNDTIEGGRGGDIIRGGAGNDVLAADRVDRFQDFDGTVSELRGGVGDDTIFGGSKDDFINGQADDDLLLGKNGNDLIIGGSGDDTLNGDVGNDTLRGVDGTDTADYSDLVINGVFGTVAGLDINLDRGRASHSSTNNALTWMDVVTNVENVLGTQRNDRFIGDEKDNLLDGQGEVGRNDRQTTFEGLDGTTYTVIADVVEYQGNSGDFTLAGTADNFTVTGSNVGTDTLVDIEFLKFNDGVFATSDLF